MKTSHRRFRRVHRRRGIQVLELLFALPVLLGLLVAALAYQRMLIVQSGLTHAAIVGAREAGKGAGLCDVTRAVNQVLAAYGVAVSERSGSVVVQDGQGCAAEDDDTPHPAPLATGPREVRVTVCLTLGANKAAGKGSGIFDVLAAAFQGKRMCASSLVSQEGPRG